MTRDDEQLRAARFFLGLPHPADDDDVAKALHYIEFLNQLFLATKKRNAKPAKRAARSLAQAILRGQRAGLPMPREWASLFYLYRDMGTTRSELRRLARGREDEVARRALLFREPPKRADGYRQRLGLQQAFWLLSDRNRPCMASLNGDWCRLAAILLGYPKPTTGLLSQARQLRILFGLNRGKISPD
jgi:hypothetical protein